MKYSIPHLNSIPAILPALLGCALFTFLLIMLATPPVGEGHRHGKNIRAKPRAISKPMPAFIRRSTPARFDPQKALGEALRHTVPAEDPQFRAERENLLSLLQSLRSDPCNDDLRKKYVGAVKTFETTIDKSWDRIPRNQWRETINAYGKSLNTSDHFNQPLIQEIRESTLEGFLSPDEVPVKYQEKPYDFRFYITRQESCANNTAYASPLEEDYWNNYRRSDYDFFDYFFAYFYLDESDEPVDDRDEYTSDLDLDEVDTEEREYDHEYYSDD